MTLRQSYGKAPHFQEYLGMLENLYDNQPPLLADFTIDSTIAIARELGIEKTKFVRSSTLSAAGAKTDRLVAILQAIGATHYISGPSAKDYIEVDKLAAAGIDLEYMVYNYPTYNQLYPPFDSYVSTLDLLFMKGTQAPEYIWGANSVNTI